MATTTLSASTVPSGVITPVTRSPSTFKAVARAASQMCVTLRRSAATSNRGSTEWSDAMSSASRTVGASAGSSRRACDGRSRSTGRPEPAAELGQAVERLGLVAVPRDDERAHAPVARLLQRIAERLVAACALQPELQQLALAEVGLGHRREHARGDVPRARLARVDHDHARATFLGLPRARQPDRPATDDGDVEAL